MKKYYKKIYIAVIVLIGLSICFQLFCIAKNLVVSAGAGGFVTGECFILKTGKNRAGNSSAEYLKEFDAYFVAQPKKKYSILHLDSGYENGFTAKISRYFKRKTMFPPHFS
jgi:hypothetical protein